MKYDKLDRDKLIAKIEELEHDLIQSKNIVNNISEEKQADEILRQMSQRLQLSTQSANIGIWELDLKSSNLIWDKKMFELYGIQPEDFGGAYDAWKKGVHPDDINRTDNEVQDAITYNKEFHSQFRVVWPDGQIRSIQAHATVVNDALGTPEKLIGVNWDITKRIQSEEALKHSKAKYKNLVETASDAIYLMSEDGIITDTNICACNMLGKSKDEIIGSTIDSIDPNYPINKFLEFWKNISYNKQRIFETSHLRKDGSLIPIELSAKKYKQNGNVFYYGIARDISERKQNLKELQESEEIFRVLYNNSPDMYASVSPVDGSILMCNDTILKKTGYSRKEVIGSPIFMMYHENCMDDVKIAFKQFVETGIVTNKELLLKRKDGSKIQVNLNVNSVKNVNGEILYSISSWRDITENIYNKEALIVAKEAAEATNANITAIIEGTNSSIWAFNRNYEILYINHVFQDEFLQAFGVELKPGVNLVDSLPATLQPFWKPRYDRVLTNDQFTVEDVVPTNDGIQYIQVTFNPIVKNGEVIGGSCFGSNITERKLADLELIKAKEQIEESEKRFKSLIENAPDAVAINNKDGEIIYVSPNTLIHFGYSEDEIIGHNGNEFTHPQDLPLVIEAIETIIRNPEKKATMQYRFRNGNGEYRWIETTFSNLLDDETINGLVLNFSDITEKKQALEDLVIAKEKAEESEKSYISLFDSVTEAIYLQNEDGTFITVNEGAVRMYGYTREEFVGNTPEMVSAPHKNDLAKVGELIKRVFETGNAEKFDFWGKRKNGEVFPKEVITTRLNYFGKDIIITSARDISDRKKIETELLEAKEKAEESDRLKSAFLANMSHEIRTPMNGIIGFTDLLKEPGLSGEQQQKFIGIIEKSGNRMLTTINDIIDISKIESGQVEVIISEINLNKQMDELFEFFLPEAKKKNIKLSITNRVPSQLANYKSDKEKLDSILTNFIKNAIKYTNSGSIEFGYSIKEIGEQNVLEFYVNDTGIGIPKNRLNAVFNRFEQADIEDRQVFEGSGLGLAISKAYVEMLGGNIWVESEEGHGSQFYFTIPYNPNNNKIPVQKSEFANKQLSIKKELKILIADDDDFVITYLNIVLTACSKELLIAKTGTEAVEICRKNPDIDIVLMDIKIPEIDGYEATRQIREFNKEVFILAQTAYAQGQDRDNCISAGCNDYIAKPINKEILLEIISNHF